MTNNIIELIQEAIQFFAYFFLSTKHACFIMTDAQLYQHIFGNGLTSCWSTCHSITYQNYNISLTCSFKKMNDSCILDR